MRTIFAVSTAFCSGFVMLLSCSAQGQNLFVAGYGDGNIYKFTPGGTRSTFASGLSEPNGVAFDSAGNLYVGDTWTRDIYKFTPDGTRTIFASGTLYPNGLAFNSAGNLLAADWSGNIYKFTPGGTRSTFASGLNLPQFVAFQPVPEPSTWGMVGMGIGVFLSGLRLSRRLS